MDRKRKWTAGLAVAATLVAFGGLGSVVFGADGSGTAGGGAPAPARFVPAQSQEPDAAPAPQRPRHRGPCHKGEGSNTAPQQAAPAPTDAGNDV